MNENYIGIGLVVLGYFLGALPFSIWVTRALKQVDVRDAGSGHATTTNTLRQAGFFAGLFVLIFDIAKGFLPTYLAIRYGPEWAIAATAIAAVIGHCWPVYAQFRGGMGLATAGGALLAILPISFFTALGTLILLTLLIKHSARAAMVFGFLLPINLYLLSDESIHVILGIGVGAVLIIRFYSDFNREYKELWLDRDKEKLEN